MDEAEMMRHHCLRKRRYKHESWAVQAMQRLKDSPHYDGQPLNVYWCKYCGAYHVGHLKY